MVNHLTVFPIDLFYWGPTQDRPGLAFYPDTCVLTWMEPEPPSGGPGPSWNLGSTTLPGVKSHLTSLYPTREVSFPVMRYAERSPWSCPLLFLICNFADWLGTYKRCRRIT